VDASISLQTSPRAKSPEEEEVVQTVGLFDFGHELFELQVSDHGTVVKAWPMFLLSTAAERR
jgi:hypothetical protein